MAFVEDDFDEFDREQFRKAQIVFDLWASPPLDGETEEIFEWERKLDDAIREHINFASIVAFALIFNREGGTELSKNARLGAFAKLANDPKQKDKAMVHSCWVEWQRQPARYKSKAAFARDMRDKFPSLESQPVIEGWCRAWEREVLLCKQAT